LPAVWVNITILSADRCSANFIKVGTFTDQTVDGPLRVSSVTGSRVQLVTAHGQSVQFDLVTHQFKNGSHP
jgi:hypothetical protein